MPQQKRFDRRNEKRLCRFSHRAMGTIFEIFVPRGELSAEGAAEEAFVILDEIDRQLSPFRPESDLSRINRAPAGTWLVLSPYAFDCLWEARRMAEATGGAFDVTVGTLLKVWKEPRHPSFAARLARARSLCGSDLFELDRNRHAIKVKRSGVTLDCGGIGKGFALERMAALFRGWDIGSFLMHSGHSTAFACGNEPGKQGWEMILQDPTPPHKVLRRLCMRSGAVSGSGLSRGLHIVDPRTGTRASQTIAAWATAPEAAWADALSTACMVMTAGEIAALTSARSHTGALLLRQQKKRTALQVLAFGTLLPHH